MAGLRFASQFSDLYGRRRAPTTEVVVVVLDPSHKIMFLPQTNVSQAKYGDDVKSVEFNSCRKCMLLAVGTAWHACRKAGDRRQAEQSVTDICSANGGGRNDRRRRGPGVQTVLDSIRPYSPQPISFTR